MTQASGEVFDIGYQHYDGPREGRARARKAVWGDGVRTALGLGRGWPSKVLPGLLFLALIFPAIIFAILGATLDPFIEDIPGQAEYYQAALIPLIILSAMIAPELLTADRRSGVINLYLVRPLTAGDYVAGRWLAFLSVALGLIYLPQIVLLIGLTLGATEPLDYLRDNWLDVPRFVGAGLVLAILTTTLPMSAAAFTTRRAYAAAFVIGLWFVATGASHSLVEASTDCRKLVGPHRHRLRSDAPKRHDLRPDLRRALRGDRRVRKKAPKRRNRRVVPAADSRARVRPLVAVQETDWMNTPKQPTIVVHNASKWYGSVVAVNDVSLRVDPGITGLLGPNGAGKTTLLHLIAGLASLSEGEVTVLGEPVRDNPKLYRRLGVMSEHEPVYGFYTGRQFVEFSARLFGLDQTGDAVDRAIEAVGLSDVQFRALGTYSRGMRQRMRLAATLVHDPEVLLLDEPLNGTDPRQRIEFQDLLQVLASEGRTILVSSHILEEIETLADSILLMVSGKLAAAGDYRAIRAKLDKRPYMVSISCSDPRSMAAALVRLGDVGSVSFDSDGSLVVMSQNVTTLQRSVPRIAQELDVRLLRVVPLDDSLESVFSYLVEA